MIIHISPIRPVLRPAHQFRNYFADRLKNCLTASVEVAADIRYIDSKITDIRGGKHMNDKKAASFHNSGIQFSQPLVIFENIYSHQSASLSR